MEHLSIHTTDGAQINLDALYKICPSCFTETKDENGELRKVVDFAKLRALLGDNTNDGAPESYDFTWVGKRAAQREAAAPITKTLRPCPEESVDWENTKNLYIEGDNLEVLKLLQNSYMGKVKMIYIDPPYNTGNDFVYHDDFSVSADEYEDASGNINEAGERFRKNTDSNGRFHSDWCSMMYARLLVARSLLREDGVIFISIGQEEVHNLTFLCNELFGEHNCEGIISRQMKSGGNQGKSFSKNIDYILVYSKQSESLLPFREPLEENLKDSVYNKIEINGPRIGERYRLMGLYQAGLNEWRPNQKYFITCPDGTKAIPPCSIQDEIMREGDGRWRWSKPRFEEELQNGNVEFVKTRTSPLLDQDGNKCIWNIYTKIWLSDRENEGRIPIDLITKLENRHSSIELKNLNIPFDFAKPSGLIKKLASFVDSNTDMIILDFFSGSATTADAILQMNADDNGNRKYILVQLREEIDVESKAYSEGYKNICEIGKERIRRAGAKIKAENPNVDTGFRVFKCDESNYKDVYLNPSAYQQEELDLFLDNIKDDRTDLDLLFDCMLRWGVELSLPMAQTKADGCTIHNVNDGDLVACFDGVITDKVIDAIAEMNPLRIVFRDSSFEEASEKMNLYELFKQKCGWSEQEVKNNVRVI